jgi:hypothetical protein
LTQLTTSSSRSMQRYNAYFNSSHAYRDQLSAAHRPERFTIAFELGRHGADGEFT